MKAQTVFTLALTLTVLPILVTAQGSSPKGKLVAQAAPDITVTSRKQPKHGLNVAQGTVPLDCKVIHLAHPNWSNGYYTIDPDGESGNPAFEAYCDMSTDAGGWTVIDYNHASIWQNYFKTWQALDNGRIAAPTGEGLPSPSWDSWVNWFLLTDSHTRFRVSPGCREVNSTDDISQSYRATGNFYGCLWYNRNCDMAPVTQECYECLDNGGRMIAGTCSHMVTSGPPTEAYKRSCNFDWWNTAPSVGIAGQYCVAYRTAFQVYLPLIIRFTFPLHIGDAIPVRAVAYQGEIFYTKSLQIPDELPSGGHFYFSSQPGAVTEVQVDDKLVALLDGAEVFIYNFSIGGQPQPAIVEMPRTMMEQLAGRIITIEYRDVYGAFVEASTMWLIWTP